jgi:hypothetical protein
MFCELILLPYQVTGYHYTDILLLLCISVSIMTTSLLKTGVDATPEMSRISYILQTVTNIINQSVTEI